MFTLPHDKNGRLRSGTVMHERHLRSGDDCFDLEIPPQKIPDVVLAVIRENAIGENYREMSSSGFKEFSASLDEQDFRLLLLALGAVGRST